LHRFLSTKRLRIRLCEFHMGPALVQPQPAALDS
jgi:hypothetical protein